MTTKTTAALLARIETEITEMRERIADWERAVCLIRSAGAPSGPPRPIGAVARQLRSV